MPIDREDFARWLDDPVTDWVMRAHRAMAAANRAEWERISWDNGIANQAALSELRTRADAYMAIAEMTFESVADANGEAQGEG